MKFYILILVFSVQIFAQEKTGVKPGKPVDCKKVEVQLRAAGKKCLENKSEKLRSKCMLDATVQYQPVMMMCGEMPSKVKADLVSEEKRMYPKQKSTLEPINGAPTPSNPQRK